MQGMLQHTILKEAERLEGLYLRAFTLLANQVLRADDAAKSLQVQAASSTQATSTR